MVFDGAPMPTKAATHITRHLSRENAKEKALELQAIGKDREAYKYLMRSVRVTPEMAHRLIRQLRIHRIECIVAPYEADAQLAYLCKTGYIAAAVSEDSDLLVFGCPVVLYKLQGDGSCKGIRLENLREHPLVNLSRWTHEQFILMSILAGCDYVKNCKSIGIKKACNIISHMSEIPRIMMKLKYEIGRIPDNYEQEVYKAFYAFLHHQVYCPREKKVVHLNCIDDQEAIIGKTGDLMFLGEKIEDDLAVMIAEGNLHPENKEAFETPSYKRKLLGYCLETTVSKKPKIATQNLRNYNTKVSIYKVLEESKYFKNDGEEIKDIDSSPCASSAVRSCLSQPFKPHIVPKGIHDLESLRFRPIDLTSSVPRTQKFM